MLEQPILNLITTPLVAGVVGYITNKIAIKMLFRPYEPKWYTFGWQGIVPKTRPKLANKISEIVSQKLLAHDDFLYALEHNDVKMSINNMIQNKLSTLSQKDIYAIIRLFNVEDKIIENKETINNLLNKITSFFIQQLSNKYINIDKFKQPLLNIIENFHVDTVLSNEINNILMNLFSDNKTLQDILPSEFINKKSNIINVLTNIIMVNIVTLGKNEDIQRILTLKVIEFKNNMFSSASGIDVLKAGFISLVLNDDKIANMVQEEFPNITYELSKNKSLYNSLYNIIEEEIDKLLHKNIPEIITSLGYKEKAEFINDINKLLTVNIDVKNKILDIILNKIYKYNNLTINEVLQILNININNFITINIIDILGSENYKIIKSNLISQMIGYISNNSYKISSFTTELSIKFIKGNLKYALHTINIEKIVKDKINALPLPEVENVLFSFMKEHFKWINILGFFIGFLIGLIQVLSVYFIK